MDAAASLRSARREAGLTQRALAQRSGTAQPTIARIEKGHEVPRLDTFVRLLGACGLTLAITRPVDGTLIGHILSLTPAQRVAAPVEEAAMTARTGRARPVVS